MADWKDFLACGFRLTSFCTVLLGLLYNCHSNHLWHASQCIETETLSICFWLIMSAVAAMSLAGIAYDLWCSHQVNQLMPETYLPKASSKNVDMPIKKRVQRKLELLAHESFSSKYQDPSEITKLRWFWLDRTVDAGLGQWVKQQNLLADVANFEASLCSWLQTQGKPRPLPVIL